MTESPQEPTLNEGVREALNNLMSTLQSAEAYRAWLEQLRAEFAKISQEGSIKNYNDVIQYRQLRDEIDETEGLLLDFVTDERLDNAGLHARIDYVSERLREYISMLQHSAAKLSGVAQQDSLKQIKELEEELRLLGMIAEMYPLKSLDNLKSIPGF
jgi:hypothetical protein